jgi:hypothetical protein
MDKMKQQLGNSWGYRSVASLAVICDRQRAPARQSQTPATKTSKIMSVKFFRFRVGRRGLFEA